MIHHDNPTLWAFHLHFASCLLFFLHLLVPAKRHQILHGRRVHGPQQGGPEIADAVEDVRPGLAVGEAVVEAPELLPLLG